MGLAALSGTRNKLETIIGIGSFEWYKERTGDNCWDKRLPIVQGTYWRQVLRLTRPTSTLNKLETIVGVCGFQLHRERTGDTHWDWRQLIMQEASSRQLVGVTKVKSRRQSWGQ